MPASPVLILQEPTTTTACASSTTETWVAWNQPYATTSGKGDGGTATTWRSWNQLYELTTPSITAGGSGSLLSETWVLWNREYTPTASTTIDPWPIWNRLYIVAGKTVSTVNRARKALFVSDEEYQAQIARAEADRREREARYEAEQRERQQAKERAAIILRENLTAEQKAELAEKQYFTLRTIRPSGEERIYRIHRGRSHNVERVDASGNKIQRYCMHPVVNCPDDDTMLTQKLWLQNPDLEEEFLRRANRS